MAKIRITHGEYTVEADSRDIYIDNENVGQVIDGLVRSLQESMTRMKEAPLETSDPKSVQVDPLDSLDQTEAFEPEFSEPEPIPARAITSKLQLLASKSFFDAPKTVSETVEGLREHGWAASPLDVSKALAKMAFNREILKNTREQRSYYFAKKTLLTT